ncbi:methylisocitrate lyase [Caldivirga sp. UBA161]|uniref:methylisocitrate lyase n=1 Tax=Caldivirga sp. UBA161 TaxID=1915569 RepID=UPI0025BF873B|nr:methylisocitrate lyase [Caldivirga sp. UBA161]
MKPVLLDKGKLKPSEVRSRFRERLGKDGIIVAPGVFIPAAAMLAEELGFEAVYFSGAAYSNMLGLPDLGVFTLSELSYYLRFFTNAINIPLIVDVDTGFGEALNVARTVRELEDTGVSAIHIEDQEMPKKCGHLAGKRVIPIDEMVKKIKAAVEARRDDNFIIIARTDARDVEGFDSAVERARAYLEAGADVIFPEALHSKEEFMEFARMVKAPLLANMTEFGKTPYITAKEFEEMGYRIVIFPVTTFRYAMGAIKNALITLKNEGTQLSLINNMMSREDIYQLIGYHDYEEWDKNLAEEANKLMSGRIKLR